MKNKGIILTILEILVLFFNLSQPVYAKVDNTESGGNITTGGGGGSGSFDGSSDGLSSGFSSGSSSSSSTSTSSGDGGLFGAVFLLVMLYAFKKTDSDGEVEPESDEKAAEAIKLVRPDFDEYDFISYTKELYLESQNTWMDKDWECVRHLEAESLFRQHNVQLREYIDNRAINHLDRVYVDRAIIKSFKMSDNHDVVEAILSSYMCDYIRNGDTNELVQGDPTEHLYTVCNMGFIYEEDDVSDSNPYQHWKLNTYGVVDEDEFYLEKTKSFSKG